MFEKFTFNSLSLGISFFSFSLPSIQFFFNIINLLLVLSYVTFGLLDFLLIRFVMVDFRMEVKLFFFEISNESILLIDKLIESFNLLSKHDDFMLEIFNFNFNVSVFIKSLLKIVDFGLVRLNFIVVISQKIVQSFNFFIK